MEELSKNVDNPDDAAELIKKIDKMFKNKKKVVDASPPSRYNF